MDICVMCPISPLLRRMGLIPHPHIRCGQHYNPEGLAASTESSLFKSHVPNNMDILLSLNWHQRHIGMRLDLLCPYLAGDTGSCTIVSSLIKWVACQWLFSLLSYSHLFHTQSHSLTQSTVHQSSQQTNR